MAYLYKAACWCDACGERIMEALAAEGHAPRDRLDETLYDSSEYPKHFADGASDSPDHCESRDECLNAIDLGDYGLGPSDALIGAETRKIGAHIETELTPEGLLWLSQTLRHEEGATPYQHALHNFWREAFADQLARHERWAPKPLADAPRTVYHVVRKAGSIGIGTKVVTELTPEWEVVAAFTDPSELRRYLLSQQTLHMR